jgi:hypothetical protein
VEIIAYAVVKKSEHALTRKCGKDYSVVTLFGAGMEKDAAPQSISVATVVAVAPVASFKDWVTEFETAYNQLVDLEDNNLPIPDDALKTLQRDTAPVFRRIYGAYARAICTLPEVIREEDEDGDADM